MTLTEQNIAIANACGWKCGNCGRPVTECQGCDFQDYPERVMPRYTTDLNAMAEARKTLSLVEQVLYVNYLLHAAIGNERKVADASKQDIRWALANATAAQHAEAFLRTKGLWKE